MYKPKDMDRITIENIVKKNFQSMNNEGMGFLTNSMKQCVDDIMTALDKEAQKGVTLKKVNEAIQKEFPTCFLVKGEGYYFIASDDEVWGNKIAMMYSQGIYTHSIKHQTIEKWLEDVRFLFSEKNLPSYAK